MKQFKVWLGVLACVALLASCVAAADPVMKFVPDTAVAVVQVKSPETLVKNADALIKALQMDALLGGKSLDSFLLQTISEGNEALDIKDLNLSKPVVASIVPNETETPDIVLAIPVKADKTSTDKVIQAFAPEGSEFKASVQGDYVLFLMKDSKLTFPFAKTKTIKLSQELTASNALVFVDVSAAKVAYKKEFEEMKASVAELLESETFSTEAEKLMAKDMLKGLLNVVDQATSLEFVVDLASNGIAFRSAFTTLAGGSVHSELKRIPAGKDIASLYKYVSKDSFIGATMDADFSALLPLFEGLIEPSLKAYNLDDKLIADYTNLVKSAYKSMGSKGAMSFDLLLDADKITKAMNGGADEASSLKAITEAIDIDVVAVQEVKDEKAYNAYLESMSKEGPFAETMFKMMDAIGFKLTFTNTAKKVDNFDYKEILMNIEVTDAEKMGLDQENASVMNELFSTLFAKWPVNYAIKNGKAFTNLGDAKKLSTLVAKDSVENNLLSNAETKAFLATLPKDAQFSMYMNIGRLGRSIVKLLPNPMFASLIPETMPGMFSYVRVKDNMVEGSCFIPTEELKGYAKIANLVIMMGGL